MHSSIGGIIKAMRPMAILLLFLPFLAQAQAPKPLIENERITAWDISIPARTNMSLKEIAKRDTVIVSLAKESLGAVEFRANDTGGGIRNSTLGAARYIVIALTDVKVPALANKSGYGLAFDRPGIKKILDNDRVTVWEYTWTPGQPTPIHFHDRDVAVVYLDDGALESTTPDGMKTVNDYKFGDTRFNKPNRIHREEVIRGKQHAILTELK
jgi:quercetin dioxygenase-like cupin family protein